MTEAVQTIHCPVLHKHGSDQQKQDISIQVDQTGMVNTPNKTLKVLLTCDEDPFFHYTLTLHEDSFSLLRSAQGLLVDFAQFPRKFTELIQQCVAEASGSEKPRFCLHVDTASQERGALLEVVEVNPFRHLSHISLKLAAASDAELKQYLAKSIKALKEDLQRERDRLASSEQGHTSQLRHTQELLAQRSSQLEQLRTELQQLSSTSSSQLQQQLAAERDKARQALWEQQQQHEAERQRLTEQHQQQTSQLEQRAATLDRQCRQLTETKYKQEVHCRDLETQLKTLETEQRQLKQEAASLRKQNASLDEEYHAKSKAVQQLKTRVAVLETEVRDRQQLLQRQEQLQQAAQQGKERLEEQLSELQATLTRREKTVKTVSQDLLKANDIIRKLQAETRALHAKLKLRSQIALEQEKLLSEGGLTRQRLEEQLREVEAREAAHQAEKSRLESELAELRDKVEAAQKLHKTNENVINWLNKQLNELQSQPRRPPVAAFYQSQHGSLPTSSELRTTVGSAPSTSTPVSGLGVPRLREPPADALAAPPAQTAGKPDTTGTKARNTNPAKSKTDSAPQDASNPPALAARYLQAAKGESVRIAGLVRRPLPAQ